MKRSKRGKIRLAVLYLILGIALCGIVYFGYREVKRIADMFGDGKDRATITQSIVTKITPTPASADKPSSSPSPTSTITPTPTPTMGISLEVTPGGSKVETPTPTPTPSYKEPFIEADNIQYQMLRYALYTSPGGTCDTAHNGKIYYLGYEALKKVLITENEANRCRPIELSEVSCGDIAYTGKALGVCVGFDDGHPIFAYCADTNMCTQRGNNMGLFLGYALCDSRELYCGSYPLPAVNFYDCAYGEGKNDFYIECRDKYFLEHNFDQFTALNDVARAMCTNDVKLFEDTIFMRELYAENLVWGKGYPTEFFKNFLKLAEAENYKDYSLYPQGVVPHEGDYGKFYDYRCAIVSLDPNTFIRRSGSYNMTVYVSNEGWIKVMPHSWMVSIRSMMREFGLEVGDRNVETDTSGETGDNASETKPKVIADGDIGVVVTDDNGVQSVAVTDAATIILGDENEYVLGNDTDAVMDMYEKNGFIINRALGAYYEGTFTKNANGDVDNLEKGVWISIASGEPVGFVDPMVHDMYYKYYSNMDAYLCYRDRVRDEYLEEYPSGYLLDAAFVIDDGIRRDCEYIVKAWDYETGELVAENLLRWECYQVGVGYEVVDINGVLYVVSEDLEKYAPGRTVSFNGINGICYRLIPEGAKRGRNYVHESFNRLPDEEGYTFMEYHEYLQSRIDFMDEYTYSTPDQYIWRYAD